MSEKAIPLVDLSQYVSGSEIEKKNFSDRMVRGKAIQTGRIFNKDLEEIGMM